MGRGGVFVLVGNTHIEGDTFDVPFVGTEMGSLDREVIVGGWWVR